MTILSEKESAVGVPTHCARCEAPELVVLFTTDHVVYWRCDGCGRLWVNRLAGQRLVDPVRTHPAS